MSKRIWRSLSALTTEVVGCCSALFVKDSKTDEEDSDLTLVFVAASPSSSSFRVGELHNEPFGRLNSSSVEEEERLISSEELILDDWPAKAPKG
jgi:hypothetical protein